MKQLLLSLTTWLLIVLHSFGQVQVDHQLQMTGSTNSDRLISNTGDASAAKDAINTNSLQSGIFTYATASNTGNAYSVTLSPTPSGYSAGMVVYFKPTAANTAGGTTLDVNGFGAKNIFMNGNQPLSSNAFLNGQITGVIYDGSNFQLIANPSSSGSSNLNFTMSLSATSLWISQNGIAAPIIITLAYVSGTTAGLGFNITGVPSGVTYSLSPGGCFPSCTASLTVTASPSATPGTYTVSLTTSGGASPQSANISLTVISTSSYTNCNGIKTAYPSALDGAYTVNPSTGSMSCYCDMTTDGGGWTLVYRDAHDGSMTQGTSSAGIISNLQALSGPSAKYADNVINALLTTQTGTAIGYRTSSPNISQKYYHPWTCVYSSGTTNPSDCMKVVNTYTTSTSPSYTQYTSWGGGGGGINCWYNGSGYANVVCSSKGYTEIGSITTNSSFSIMGGSSTTYGNTLLIWVK